MSELALKRRRGFLSIKKRTSWVLHRSEGNETVNNIEKLVRTLVELFPEDSETQAELRSDEIELIQGLGTDSLEELQPIVQRTDRQLATTINEEIRSRSGGHFIKGTKVKGAPGSVKEIHCEGIGKLSAAWS